MKAKYITPEINNIFLLTNDNIAQFVVCSYAVGEDAGLAKETSSMKTKIKYLKIDK